MIINSFPPMSSSGAEGSIPSGLIAMWSGASDAIPDGWKLCDGTNNTPDLRNRFIVGAGSNYTVGNTGGSDTVTLTTSQMPSHTHTATLSGNANIYGDISWNEVGRIGDSVGNNENVKGYVDISSSSYSGSLFADLSDGTVTVSKTGSGSSHENRPPYYALCFIMKS